MRITWVLDGIEPDGEGGYTSRLASHRYRAILPAVGLRDLGHQVDFVALDRWLAGPLPDGDVVVLGKHLPGGGDDASYRARGEASVARAREAVAAGLKVVADFNDDHFDHPVMGPYWRALADAVSHRTAGSDAMRERVFAATGRSAQVIGDPVASPRGTVRVRQGIGRTPGGLLSRWTRGARPGDERLRLLWFGHPVNWAAMQAWLPRLATFAQEVPLRLQIVTMAVPVIHEAVEAVNREGGASFAVSLIPWDETTQWAALEHCDLVLLPSDPRDPRKAVKTANRLTDALHAGRPVIASPLPAYQPWRPHVMFGDDPIDGLRLFLADPDAQVARVRTGQQAVELACSVPVIAQAWEDLLSSTAGLQGLPASVTALAGGVRLNLGCGRRHMDGFVNVDFAQNWSGREPDVVADISKPLPFPDGLADEIHAYHVLEHLLRWEVEDCLREWIRVLKPGGRLVLEMPCLDKILGIFNSHMAEGRPAPLQYTVYGLFGDPGYRDVHMLHRWCYSFDELRTVLDRVGLIDVRSEPPQTHVAIRDMRMVGTKSACCQPDL